MNNEAQTYLQQPGTVFLDVLNAANMDEILHQMENDNVSAGVFRHSDYRELVASFKAHLIFIQAAGGFIYTPQKEILLIFRRGKWDLPKGKVDEGESLETCATREVEEETGLANAKIVESLSVTYHTYHEKGKQILKESHWFLMTSASLHLKPQVEEDIEKSEWKPIEEVLACRPQMHASIVDVIQKGVDRLRWS